MIETQLHPSLRAVALATFLSIAPSVFVISFVARKAGFSFCVVMKITTMAGIAADDSVLASEWKVRFGVVVEIGFCPARRRVARRAALTIAPRMNVAQTVAGNTCGRGVFVMLIDMAQFAAGLAMLTPQRK